ncbi:MAG: aminoacyl-tRNA hydrolase [Clostridia bacterium]|nr:aminoacyl-tRNA hydrolase [Clostridia bacterium]NLF19930.1 aminoacyl-tRNA hydrolase [Clostridiaceae bacterium]
MFRVKEISNREEVLAVVGLGNPGSTYEASRHNCGFMVVDRLAAKYGGRWSKTRFNAETCRIVIGQRRVMLVKPLTYMNNSGEAVQKLKAYYRMSSADILVIYDDVDVKLGQIRIREKGGPGSHNGMKSLVRLLAGGDFPRIRVGIGPQPEHYDIVDFVLGKFSSDEQMVLEQALAKAVTAVEVCAEAGLQIAMNRLNTRGNGETD